MIAMRPLRAARGESQTEVANLAGVNQGLISKIERGLVKPSRSVRLRLASHFGISERELFANIVIGD